MTINALLAASTRRNGKSMNSTEQAAMLLDAMHPHRRIVLKDLTIRFRGLAYSTPFASPGDLVTVFPLAGNSIAIACADGSFASTSASADRSRNHHGRHRATSRPTHSGISTSVGKTQHQSPMTSPAAYPAMPPVRLRRRMPDNDASAAERIFHPIQVRTYSPEPAPKSRYGKGSSDTRHP